MAENSPRNSKHCGTRKNCWFREISHFPHSVFKRLVLQTRERDIFTASGLDNDYSEYAKVALIYLQNISSEVLTYVGNVDVKSMTNSIDVLVF